MARRESGDKDQASVGLQSQVIRRSGMITHGIPLVCMLAVEP